MGAALFSYGLLGLGTFGAAGWTLWDYRKRWGHQKSMVNRLFWVIGAFFAVD